jgi:polysaccharide export outer membrane protein
MDAKPVPVLVAVLLTVGAGFLTGCGASLNSEMTSGLAAGEQQAGAGSGVRSGRELESSSRPQPETAATFTSITTSGSTAYKIGAHDVLDVSVFKVPELSKSVQVAETGTINLPLVGEIPAAGRTAQEVERDLASRLGAKFLQKPQVTVYVKEYNSQRVTVEGAVKKPGVYPIKGKASLLQCIAMAEGFDQSFDSTVVVFRYTNGNRTAAQFDISAIRSGQAEDPALQTGDVIVVGTSAIKESFNNAMKILPALGVFALFH